MKKINTTVAALLFAINLPAQPTIEWQKSYGGKKCGQSIFHCTDNRFCSVNKMTAKLLLFFLTIQILSYEMLSSEFVTFLYLQFFLFSNLLNPKHRA